MSEKILEIPDNFKIEESIKKNETKIIQPFCGCSAGLDDLENVVGFNREGKKDAIYGFKLSDPGYYIRHEIVAVSLDNLENVNGFNQEGKKDAIYGFKLSDQGIYERVEIVFPISDLKN
jgi:hypothetical protein